MGCCVLSRPYEVQHKDDHDEEQYEGDDLQDGGGDLEPGFQEFADQSGKMVGDPGADQYGDKANQLGDKSFRKALDGCRYQADQQDEVKYMHRFDIFG